MILVIDNYDSFTYNLVQVMSAQGGELEVYRNDEISIEEIARRAPKGLLISPGPCTPNEAGISVAAATEFSGKMPVLGVCLGLQSIAVAFGATVDHSQRIMHGKTSKVEYKPSPLYEGIQSPFVAGRYHSLSIRPETLPDSLTVDATSDDGEIMGVRHISHPTFGVQFHPESVLTPSGKRFLKNYLDFVDDWHAGEISAEDSSERTQL